MSRVSGPPAQGMRLPRSVRRDGDRGRRVGVGGFTDPRVLAALGDAADSGRRIAAICTGAFVLAQAGLLDGRAATTYWRYSAELTRRFPAVDLQPDVLYVQDGQILTSAGLAAGMDLCLHMIRTDHGAAVANTVARLAVVALVRPGGQAQFVDSALPPERGASLADTREWARQRLYDPLSLADLAAHARVSVRTLTRRFHAETGLSPCSGCSTSASNAPANCWKPRPCR
jgi:transcriptional regulator GlxA family with amidase domain